ncbi:carboxymuconolactone decarboxylase family protein [Andreprevotia chitinilytica]|uniref:carboxymuconolactone decarboxylase family protein n=1 Tax=Andreprevotia chitinilytica TaxID=396808 RepID=UPI0005566B69|nr:carboxymuconolactone decarboxylase family protein [Andreprevotia chitinilytica]
MSQSRLPYATLAPEAYKAMIELSAAVDRSPLGKPLIELLFLRISQINGCAYCLDMHARNLLKGGEDLQRIVSLPAWRETTFFTERERAALAWVESLTLIAESHAPDELFDALRPHFTDEEIAALTFTSALMNAWNRIAISSRQPVAKAALLV